MFVAVVGCVHGELDKIYKTVSELEESHAIKVSLVICCGDFQGVRNFADVHCMRLTKAERDAINRTQTLYDFHRYYSGEKTAPITTILVGGNHEASNFLQELPYGGYIAPNIYYMGYAGVVNFGSLRIAGISGIYKEINYGLGRTERPPYTRTQLQSVYCYRVLEVFRLLQIRTPIDIMLSHDWPKNIHVHGDNVKLYFENEKFRKQMDRDDFGIGPLRELLLALKPAHWLAGHMHVKFSALMNHEDTDQWTSFLGLSRANSDVQDFLEIIEFPDVEEDSLKLSFDPEWLAILQKTNHLLSVEEGDNPNFIVLDKPVHIDGQTFIPSEDEVKAIRALFNDNLEIDQLQTFEKTAPSTLESDDNSSADPPTIFVNPQTTNFIQKLGLTDPFQQ